MTIKDKQIWENYTRGLASVSKARRQVRTAQPVTEKVVQRQSAETSPSRLPKLTRDHQGVAIAHVWERKREKKLRHGEIDIDGRLDLHGMTQSEAFEALSHFIHKKKIAGKRHLLIITGKGRAGDGVLRRNLSQWLGQLPEASAILGIRPASIKHGGEGAFYVVLRKR